MSFAFCGGEMRLGYAHEVGADPDLDSQIAALTAFGCEEFLVEHEVGDEARARLDEYLYNLRVGDELVLAGFDVLTRTTGKLVVVLEGLLKRGVSVTTLLPAPLTFDVERQWSALDILEVLARHEEVRMRQRFHPEGGRARNSRRYRLDEARAAEALRRFQAGERLAAIARDFGVDPRIVDDALSGRRRRGESVDGQGRTVARRTRLNAPTFEIMRPAGAEPADENGGGGSPD